MFIKRKRTQSKQYVKYLYFCLFIVGTILIYFLLTDKYFTKLVVWKIPSTAWLSQKEANSYSRRRNISQLTLNDSIMRFHSTVPSYYPSLPVHMFTQNLSLLTNNTKLILLGNGFFGVQNWGLSAIGKSSVELMTQLGCPFLSNYCDITIDKSRFSQADAIVYHVRDDIDIKEAERNRYVDQRFVFTLWESPVHTPDLDSYNGFFNWTMTYRPDSHIVASYYSNDAYIHKSNNYYDLMMKENETKKLNLQLKQVDYQFSIESLKEKRLGTIAALISNCGGQSQRSYLIRNLKRYVDVQVYGRCGQPCPDKIDCRAYIAKNYYFFLSFENSLCTDYTTEKFFAMLQHPIVPIVFGRTNYSSLIPSSGFIDVNDFSNLTALTQYIIKVREDKNLYLSYFAWKKDYVWGLSQFFTPFCDLCIRLHLDPMPNTINNIDAWWKTNTCQKTRWLRL